MQVVQAILQTGGDRRSTGSPANSRFVNQTGEIRQMESDRWQISFQTVWSNGRAIAQSRLSLGQNFGANRRTFAS
ncbi:hypothetical protein HPC62_22325 [Thermoleptolyngbya sichuanensis A183]|uniref:Uncharacterized protein n=1 Tax=Thermoleptolyngbya sichuanensis A183 TaxID=2737172 RepID=A0A6M8BJ74_9CYAN|nr:MULTISPECIES: hypothetical protein [Thermoleptolyngbya]QKD84556.1 hypothetical protein HPC62_22325 [Thermoleptolyngbya sichuanensis A183]